MYTRYPYPDELYHYGVKGMKWGIINENPFDIIKSRLKKKKSKKQKDDSRTIAARKVQQQMIAEKTRQEKDRRAQDMARQSASDKRAADRNDYLTSLRERQGAVESHGSGGSHVSRNKSKGIISTTINVAKAMKDPIKDQVMQSVKTFKTNFTKPSRSRILDLEDKVIDKVSDAADKYESAKKTASMIAGKVKSKNYTEEDLKKASQYVYTQLKPYVQNNVDTNAVVNQVASKVSDATGIDEDELRKEILKYIK